MKDERKMEYIQDYFLCENCKSKDFTRIYNFSLRFHGVNFSDELIYDKLTDEIYQCTNCQKRFTADQIEAALADIKAKRKLRSEV